MHRLLLFHPHLLVLDLQLLLLTALLQNGPFFLPLRLVLPHLLFEPDNLVSLWAHQALKVVARDVTDSFSIVYATSS